MQEEEDHKEQQRQNFNNMVEAARAEAAQNPPAPHDPMRFRAVPPGTLTCTQSAPLLIPAAYNLPVSTCSLQSTFVILVITNIF